MGSVESTSYHCDYSTYGNSTVRILWHTNISSVSESNKDKFVLFMNEALKYERQTSKIITSINNDWIDKDEYIDRLYYLFEEIKHQMHCLLRSKATKVTQLVSACVTELREAITNDSQCGMYNGEVDGAEIHILIDDYCHINIAFKDLGVLFVISGHMGSKPYFSRELAKSKSDRELRIPFDYRSVPEIMETISNCNLIRQMINGNSCVKNATN